MIDHYVFNPDITMKFEIVEFNLNVLHQVLWLSLYFERLNLCHQLSAILNTHRCPCKLDRNSSYHWFPLYQLQEINMVQLIRYLVELKVLHYTSVRLTINFDLCSLKGWCVYEVLE